MKELGLGVLGLGEGSSIISAGVHGALVEAAALCGLNEAPGRLHVIRLS